MKSVNYISLQEVQDHEISYNPFEKRSNDELCYILENLLNTLTLREAKVLREYFDLESGVGKTLKNIGGCEINNKTNDIGVGSERIRQIRDKAIRKLRHPVRGAKYLLADFIK